MPRTRTNTTATTKPSRKSVTAAPCMCCGEKPACTRDVCYSCYQQARKMVIKGITNWDELAKFGLIAGEKVNPMLDKFNKIKLAETVAASVNHNTKTARAAKSSKPASNKPRKAV